MTDDRLPLSTMVERGPGVRCGGEVTLQPGNLQESLLPPLRVIVGWQAA